MKLCKDCKHLRSDQCYQGEPPSIPDYVNGGMRYPEWAGLRQTRKAQDMREAPTKCGPEAKWFEPK